jgi:hypothetical protein
MGEKQGVANSRHTLLIWLVSSQVQPAPNARHRFLSCPKPFNDAKGCSACPLPFALCTCFLVSLGRLTLLSLGLQVQVEFGPSPYNPDPCCCSWPRGGTCFKQGLRLQSSDFTLESASALENICSSEVLGYILQLPRLGGQGLCL